MSMPTAPRRRRLCRPWVSWNGKWRGEEGSKSVWLGWKHGHFFGLPLHFQCVPVLHTQPVHWVRYYRWDLYGEKLVQPLKNETLPSPVVIWHIYIYVYNYIYIYYNYIYIWRNTVVIRLLRKETLEISSRKVDHFLIGHAHGKSSVSKV